MSLLQYTGEVTEEGREICVLWPAEHVPDELTPEEREDADRWDALIQMYKLNWQPVLDEAARECNHTALDKAWKNVVNEAEYQFIDVEHRSFDFLKKTGDFY